MIAMVIESIAWNVPIDVRGELSRATGSAFRMAADKDDLVITPGGPRPRDQVRHVRPGEAVQRNDDGTYTVVPKNPPTGPKSTVDGNEDK